MILVVLPGIGAIIVRKLLLNARNMVLKDVRGLVATVKIPQATVVELYERLAQLRLGIAFDTALAIDLLVVLALGSANFLKQVLAHLDARLTIAVLNDIDGSVRKDPTVVGTAPAIIKNVGRKQARRDRILTVTTDVGKNIRDANDAALERHGTQMPNCAIARGNAILNRLVKLVKGAHVRELKHTLLVLAVMA